MSRSDWCEERRGTARPFFIEHHFSRFVQKSFVLLFCSIVLSLFGGCALSSPRFTSEKHVSDKDSIPSKYAAQIAEEKKEDDRHAISADNLEVPEREESNPAINRHRMLNQIMAAMGTPYAYSRSDSEGIDCSGFTSLVYRKALGFDLPRSCAEQFGLGDGVERERLRFGDLVFFNTEGDSPSHVGIYVGDGLFAHASVSIGVTISVLESMYYKKRYAGARRIVQ